MVVHHSTKRLFKKIGYQYKKSTADIKKSFKNQKSDMTTF